MTGCSRVSPGCEHCYAETLSLRWKWSLKPWTGANAQENVKLHPDRLTTPLGWKRPRLVFVNSMSDLFHDFVPTYFLDQVFAVMALSSRHTFQVLTKRPERMHDYIEGLADCRGSGQGFRRLEAAARELGYTMEFEGHPMLRWPIPNIWLGVSVEDQRRAVERIPILLSTPAAVRWISAEPLLGPIDLHSRSLNWVVVGGESGPKHRPMDPAWARSLRDQCLEAGVPFFFKQVGGRTPKAGGRLLDGVTWDQYPSPRVHA